METLSHKETKWYTRCSLSNNYTNHANIFMNLSRDNGERWSRPAGYHLQISLLYVKCLSCDDVFLRGNCTSNKIEYVLCTISKLSLLFLTISIAFRRKLSQKLENSLRISVNRAVPELLIKTCKVFSWRNSSGLIVDINWEFICQNQNKTYLCWQFRTFSGNVLHQTPSFWWRTLPENVRNCQHEQVLFWFWQMNSQFMQSIVSIDNSRFTWPIKFLMPFLNFSDKLLSDAYIIFKQCW